MLIVSRKKPFGDSRSILKILMMNGSYLKWPVSSTPPDNQAAVYETLDYQGSNNWVACRDIWWAFVAGRLSSWDMGKDGFHWLQVAMVN